MPCVACGRIQNDPVKGSSPWARAVAGGRQILVCPECQHERPEWTAELDSCPRCSSTRLSIVMGSAVCRACHLDWVVEG